MNRPRTAHFSSRSSASQPAPLHAGAAALSGDASTAIPPLDGRGNKAHDIGRDSTPASSPPTPPVGRIDSHARVDADATAGADAAVDVDGDAVVDANGEIGVRDTTDSDGGDPDTVEAVDLAGATDMDGSSASLDSAPPHQLDTDLASEDGQGRPRRHKLAKFAIVGAGVVAAALALAYLNRPSDSRQEAIEDGVDVEGGVAQTAVVVRQDLIANIQLQAQSAALDATVSPPDGTFATPAVEDGARVAAGDAVLHLVADPEALSGAKQAVADARTALKQAEADATGETNSKTLSVAAAQTTLDRANTDLALAEDPPADPIAVTEAQRALEDASTAVDVAVAEGGDVGAAERARDRAEADLASAQDPPADAITVAAARRAAEDAQAELDVANGTTLVAGTTVEAAQQALTAAEGRLTTLEEQDTVMYAPVDGVVRYDAAKVAHIVGDYAVTANLLPVQQLRLTSGAATATASIEAAAGMSDLECADLRFEGLSQQQVDATQQVLDAAANANPYGEETGADQGAATARAVCVPTEPIPQIAGLRGTLDVELTVGENVLVVPDAAIQYRGDQPVVTTTDGDTIEVTVGATDGVLRIVTGIDEGAEVTLP